MQIPFASLISSAYLKLGVAVALTAVLAYGVWAIRDSGVQATEQKHKAALAEHIQRAASQAHQIAMQDAEVSEYYEKWRVKTVVKTETITNEIPADCRTCTLSPAGLLLLNSAIRGGPASPDSGKPNGGMSPNTTPNNGLVPGSNRGASCCERGVQRLRYAPQVIDSSDQNERI
jgi:hypothetical protein